MRSAAAAFLVIFFIVFSFWGVGSWSCNQPKKQNSEAQQRDDTKHNNCATPYGAIIVGLHDTGDFVHIFHEEIVAVSTVVIAIFTLILGVFTINLSKSTRIAADTAREALTKLERAFVYSKGLGWKAYLNPVSNDRGGVFTAEWHNGGTTQAKHFLTHTSWDTWLWFDGDMPADFVFVDKGQPSPGASFIPPKSSLLSTHLPIEPAVSRFDCSYGAGLHIEIFSTAPLIEKHNSVWNWIGLMVTHTTFP
jgi:hypothetical protein